MAVSARITREYSVNFLSLSSPPASCTAFTTLS